MNETKYPNEPLPSEIVVEIDEEFVNRYEKIIGAKADGELEKTTISVTGGNGSYFFFPVETALRGRLNLQRFGRQFDLDRAVRGIPDVPGMRIHLNVQDKIGRVTDPLRDAANKGLFRELNAAAGQMELPFILRSEDPIVREFGDDYSYWTWVFHMRKLIDLGCAESGVRMCRPVQNVHQMPTIAQCVESRRVRLPISDGTTRQKLDEYRRRTEPNYQPAVDEGILTPELASARI